MLKNKRQLTSLLLVFALLLTSGVVYAALNGMLTFSGTAELLPPPPPVRLDIIPAEDPEQTVLGSTGTMTVAADGQSADIAVVLAAPGESITLSFKVENVGEMDALIKAITTTNDNDEIVISGDYVDLEGQTVEVDETFPLSPVDITIEWPTGGEWAEDAGTCEFTIILNYEQIV